MDVFEYWLNKKRATMIVALSISIASKPPAYLGGGLRRRTTGGGLFGSITRLGPRWIAPPCAVGPSGAAGVDGSAGAVSTLRGAVAAAAGGASLDAGAALATGFGVGADGAAGAASAPSLRGPAPRRRTITLPSAVVAAAPAPACGVAADCWP